jgi:tetratricopeptide (TPR) repeat protein
LSLALIGGLLYYASLGRLPTSETSGDLATFETAASPVRKLLSQGRIDDALKTAVDLRAKFPAVPDAHMLVGNLLALQQKNDQAIEAYVKAQELGPDDPLIHANLVRLYFKSGQPEKAGVEMAVIDKMVSEGKHSKALFVEAAQLLLEFRKQIKQPPEKAMILAKALQTQVAPESSIGFKLEAQAHDQEGRKPEALAAIDKGLLVEPNDTWLLEHSAILRLELRDLAGATTTVEKWIERHPASHKPLLIMGYLKFQGGDPNGAIRYLQQILQSSNNNLQIPEAREAIYLLGQIAFSQKGYRESVELYKQACQAGFEPACNQEIAVRKTLEEAPPTEGEPGADALPSQAPPVANPAPTGAEPNSVPALPGQ